MPRDDAVVQLRRVVSHSLHPDFATPGHLHYHDVSVLVLEEGLDLSTEFVRPVHLPTVEDVERLKGGDGEDEQQVVDEAAAAEQFAEEVKLPDDNA